MAAPSQRTSQRTGDALRILIVGAGMSGLSAAISCALAGHRVMVVEGARELAEVGAGFQITPNGTKALQQFGVLEGLAAQAAEPTVLQVRRWADGAVLSRTEDFHVTMRKRYHSPFWDLHRVDVQRALAQRARALGVHIRLGARVDEMDIAGPDCPSVTLTTGERLSAQLLVSADGLWSKCRQNFWKGKEEEDAPPLPTGDLAYRIVLDLDQVRDQDLRDMIAKPSCQFWVGPGAHVVAYSIRNGTQYNIVLLVPDDLPAHVARQSGSVEEMRAIFHNWDPVLNRFLDHVRTVDKWKLMHRPPLERWVSPESNFVLVGDACHPMLPYLAQGVNSSIEDGAVLGNVLAALEHRSQLPAALQLYERLRKKRGEAIVRETFAQRHDFHLPDGEEQQARDELMGGRLGKEIDCKFPSRWQCPIVQPWLYGYDATEETKAALRETPLPAVTKA